MRCLALRHIECEDLGAFDEPLRRRFDEVAYVDMAGQKPAGEALEAVAGADLVVALGGPMAVYEAARYPFLAREIELIGARLAAGRPTLGICLGAQIMAQAAGGRVYPGPRQEVGWYAVTLAAAALTDPALSALAAGENMFFHWHGDTFDLPPGAEPLGSSARFANQGFTLGRHGVALQFHAEVDAAGLERWLALYDKDLRPRAGVMGPAELREGMRRHGAGLVRRGHDFLDRWLEGHWPAPPSGAGVR